MTERELWILIRRNILTIIAIIDKYYDVCKGAEVKLSDGDSIATSQNVVK